MSLSTKSEFPVHTFQQSILKSLSSLTLLLKHLVANLNFTCTELNFCLSLLCFCIHLSHHRKCIIFCCSVISCTKCFLQTANYYILLVSFHNRYSLHWLHKIIYNFLVSLFNDYVYSL